MVGTWLVGAQELLQTLIVVVVVVVVPEGPRAHYYRSRAHYVFIGPGPIIFQSYFQCCRRSCEMVHVAHRIRMVGCVFRTITTVTMLRGWCGGAVNGCTDGFSW